MAAVPASAIPLRNSRLFNLSTVQLLMVPPVRKSRRDNLNVFILLRKAGSGYPAVEAEEEESAKSILPAQISSSPSCQWHISWGGSEKDFHDIPLPVIACCSKGQIIIKNDVKDYL